MKKIVLILSFLVAFNISSQEFYPQLSFYSNNSPLAINYKNDVEEYNQLKHGFNSSSINGHLSERQLLNMLYRMYEIEKTSEITYATINGNELPFQCMDVSEGGLAVNFGAPLIVNENNYDSSFKLRFGSPVTEIDPALFSSEVEWVKLPSSKNIIYKSSPSIMTYNLEILEGPDVVNHSALISKDKTLIVAATRGKDCFQIPDGVLIIGAGACRGSWSSSVVIPSSVTAIGDNAFDLSFIKRFIILSESVPTIGKDAFGENPDKDVMLYVPQKVLGEYKKSYPYLKSNLASLEKNKGIYYLIQAKLEYDNKNYSKALELFELAAQNKCHEANYWLGDYYTHIDPDPQKAYSYFEKGAKKKHVESMYMCHYYPMYYSEPRNMNAALKWLKLADKYGNQSAAHELGNIYSDREHKGFPLNLQEALNAYRKVTTALFIEFDIECVENLISLGADQRMRLLSDASISFDDEISQFVFSFIQKKKDFCMYDLAVALIKEYNADEEDALQYSKILLDQWMNMGIVSYK